MLAVYAASRNLYQYLPMTVGSLLRHNPNWRVLIYCEDNEIETLKDDRVSFVNVNSLDLPLAKNNPNLHTKYGPFTLIRCYLPKLLPEEKRILWLDVDTCILESLEHLETMPLPFKAVGGVLENQQPPPGAPEEFQGFYINAGVLLMNLEFIRQKNFDDRWIELLTTRSFCYPDQDAINLSCNGFVKLLDTRYNYSPSTVIVPLSHPKIIHYTFQKVWDNPWVDLWRRNYIQKLGDEPELK